MKKIKHQKICYFGTFPKNQAYSRNLIMDRCFHSIGCEVHECCVETHMSAAKRIQAFKSTTEFLSSLLSIFSQWYNLCKKHYKISDYDLMIVGYPSHIDVFLGFLLSKIRRRPLIMDAFISVYDTVVKDRKLINETNLISRLLWLFEWSALHLADKVMVDTQEHQEFLVKAFRLKPDCVFAIPVGIDENIWKPLPLPLEKNCFTVAIWSTFIPLHGMQAIVEAADVLATQNCNIKIQIIGEGQTADLFAKLILKKKLKNIEWRRGFFDIQDIVNMAENSHCCLGIFGTSEKTNRVIPYKVYQTLSMARPVITSDTSAMRRIFSETPGGILVSPGDGKKLAKALIKLSKDYKLCQRLAENARTIYNEKLSNKIIQQILDLELKRLI